MFVSPISAFYTNIRLNSTGNEQLLVDLQLASKLTLSVGWHGILLSVPICDSADGEYVRFAIPFMFSTTLGLSAVALRSNPAMRVLSPDDVSAGLPASAAAAALLGKGGAVILLIVLFLAVTSATSAELIAVSSILTYDVYKV